MRLLRYQTRSHSRLSLFVSGPITAFIKLAPPTTRCFLPSARLAVQQTMRDKLGLGHLPTLKLKLTLSLRYVGTVSPPDNGHCSTSSAAKASFLAAGFDPPTATKTRSGCAARSPALRSYEQIKPPAIVRIDALPATTTAFTPET